MKKKTLLVAISLLMIAFTGCKNNSVDMVSLRDQGVVLMESGDYEAAISTFNEALAASGGKVTDLALDINYYKAAAQYQAGLYEDAIATYTALVRYDRNNYAAYFLRGCVYANTKAISKACADYDSAIEIDNKNYELYIEIYENLSSIEYGDKADYYINKLFEMKDNSAEAKYYKGRGYYLTKDYVKAEEFLDAAVKKNINEAKLYLAKLYQDTGDMEKAKTLLEEYASSDEINGEAMAALGDIEMSKAEYETALNYYETGIGLDNPENLPQLYKGKIVALEYLGRFDEALATTTQYLEAYPGDEDAQRELIFLKTR